MRDRECSVAECERLVGSKGGKGLCPTHLRRRDRHGDAAAAVRIYYRGLTTEERFWKYVDKSGGPEACWLWTGYRDRWGYGKFNVSKGVAAKAHRFALSTAAGPIDSELYACHRCDNPPCCNPAHLFVGTATDNNRDMSSKGRHWLSAAAFCKSGHAWSEVNTALTPSGNRRCRECSRLRSKARRDRASKPESWAGEAELEAG